MPSLFSILACLGRRFAATIFLFSVFGRPVMLLHIRHFNSCSLREERSTWYLYKMNVATFQFSLPRVRSDPTTKMPHLLPDNFNSRSLYGERSIADASWFSKVVFQFLLPAWGAISRNFCCRCSSWFQFSPSAWGAIKDRLLVILHAIISILAPFVGSDMIDQLNLFEHWNFNSRSLPGERYDNLRTKRKCMGFNSRPPEWGAI